MPDADCVLSIVVPTRNEAPNVVPLVRGVYQALAPHALDWELLFVDDSDDQTPEVVARLADELGRVRLLHRPSGARPGGLGGAVQAGFSVAEGQILAVMDGDLQHPPAVLPALIAPVLAGEADLVAGSRYGLTGGTGGLDGRWRRFVSSSCRQLAHLAVPASRPLEDPLSGLFAVKRSVVEAAELRPDGYKILLEVAARGHWQSAGNVTYQFAERYAGNSKANFKEGLVFFRHLAKLTVKQRGRRSFTVVPSLVTSREPAASVFGSWKAPLGDARRASTAPRSTGKVA